MVSLFEVPKTKPTLFLGVDEMSEKVFPSAVFEIMILHVKMTNTNSMKSNPSILRIFFSM